MKLPWREVSTAVPVPDRTNIYLLTLSCGHQVKRNHMPKKVRCAECREAGPTTHVQRLRDLLNEMGAVYEDTWHPNGLDRAYRAFAEVPAEVAKQVRHTLFLNGSHMLFSEWGNFLGTYNVDQMEEGFFEAPK